MFGQGSSASLRGTVLDASQAVLPGATITVINVDTAVETTTTTNGSGIYNFPSLQPGVYHIIVKAAGFQQNIETEVKLGIGYQLWLNFDMWELRTGWLDYCGEPENVMFEVSSSAETVVVRVARDETADKLPLLSNNVMELINVMGGVVAGDDPIFTAASQTFAGVSSGNINVQRDGMSVSEVRYGAGITSSANMNTEMIGELKMILSPVDAEMGRGAGQVQMTTKSGSNAWHGSAVWNNQNTALDAREFEAKRTNTPPNWRNLNNYTLSASGPIIKNRTFFFATWDHSIDREKQQMNIKSLTPCARKGIYRYLTGWSNGNRTTTPVLPGGFGDPARSSVTTDGKPLLDSTVIDPYSGATMSFPAAELKYESIFGALDSSLLPANFDDPNNPSGVYGDCSDFTAFNSQTRNLGVVSGSYLGASTYRSAYDSTGFVSRFTDGAYDADGKLIVGMPLPNNYEMGDGLNYAGYRWTHALHGTGSIYGTGGDPDRKSITFKIDHNINNDHRVSGTYTYEKYHVIDHYRQWPEEYGGYEGQINRTPQNLSLALTSTLLPTLLNELRFGLSRTSTTTVTPLDNKDGAKMKQVLETLLPTGAGSIFAGTAFEGNQLILGTGTGSLLFHTDPNTWGGTSSHPYGSRGNIPTTFGGVDPRWTLADTVTWMKGAHSFKGGIEYRRQSSQQENTGVRGFAGTGAVTMPFVFGGLTALASQGRGGALAANWNGATGIAGNGAPNLVGQDTPGNATGNYAAAYDLMTYFSGSLGQIRQFYYVDPNDNTAWNNPLAGGNNYVYKIANQEISFFFKDDWKVTSDLTLNLGVRWEYYGVPYVADGRTAALVGGSSKIFGLSGGDLSNWMKGDYIYDGSDPVSRYQFVGPDSDNSSLMPWNRDKNNFAPHVGFAWQLPWFGRGKTTLRGGYSISYSPVNNFDQYGIQIADVPGVTYTLDYRATDLPYMDITDLPTVLPLTSWENTIRPLQARQNGALTGYATIVDENIRNPYVQSLNLSLTRNISNNVTVDVRYIGTLSRKQIATTNLNSGNYINNGLYRELNIVRNGGESDVINSLIPVGSLAWGMDPDTYAQIPISGSQQLRASGSTMMALAQANFSSVAGTLETTNGILNVAQGVQGAVLRQTNSCLPTDRVGGTCTKPTPWNYIYTNPQFSYAGLVSNAVKTNYHSMQAQVTMRPTRGISFQTTYTWSRNLGDATQTDYISGTRDYYLSGQHRSHQLNSYGTFDLPFGANGVLFRDATGAFKKTIEGWQLSWIASITSGQPASITGINTLWSNSQPVLVRPDLWDNKAGSVSWAEGGDAGYYFGQKYMRVSDANICGGIDPSLAFWCTNAAYGGPQALALVDHIDAAGNPVASTYTSTYTAADGTVYNPGDQVIVFRNADPRLGADAKGNFSPNQITGQGRWTLDMAMSKSVEFMEGKRLEIRVDAQNIFNHATPSNSSIAWSSRFTSIGNPQL
ncbi:MAG: TonB-dependent receptor, partial [Acidobacteriota bacterium]|nr:TonB-dependent receptor [Acidobacteriota bacterium]